VKAAFGRAVATYDQAAVLHGEIGSRMAERLDVVRLDAARVLDAGCGTGASIAALRRRFPGASVVALDLALAMVAETSRRHAPSGPWLRSLLGAAVTPRAPAVHAVCADMAALPLAAGSVDLVWSNLAVQWCAEPARAFAEFRRVLRTGGLLMFSTLGPDTLAELRAAFARVDSLPHTLGFIDMHDVGDMLVGAGFADPVMDAERITVDYAGSRELLRDLRGTGARNAAVGRLRGLTGRRRWQRALEALERQRTPAGLSMTYEVVYGHAWKPEPRQTPEGHAILRRLPTRKG
jgi:malonyl-CoA O-methyltransferase